MNRWRAQFGFTLIEMSVVLVVIAIISAMGVSAGMDAVESTRRVATEHKLDVLEDSLMAFRKRYGRLPCPGDSTLATTSANYGLEAANNEGTCTGGTPAATYVTPFTGIPSGVIPVRTLNLPDEFMYDGWDRKFHYEVTPAMTRDNAFSVSWPFDDCSVTAIDHSGENYSLLPVYSLVSYGKNGIGAYLKSGSQYTQGTAGTDEKSNIRQGVTGAVQAARVRSKNAVSGVVNTATYYDDIVRFKSRYQLMDEIDRDTENYKGPEMVLGYSTDSGVQLVYGKRTCGEWKAYSGGTVPGTVGAQPRFIGFTPNNTNLLVQHDGGICKLYSIIGTTVAAVTETTPVPNCPDTGSIAGAIAQNNGMMALLSDSAPYIRVYRMIGSGASAKFTELPNALDPPLEETPDHVSLSANGEYLAVAGSLSDWARLYVNKGDHYQYRGAVPNEPAKHYGNAISPNGKYYVITDTVTSVGNTRVYIWRNINGSFTRVGSAPAYTAAGMQGHDLTFSPNSDYLALHAHELVVLHIDPVTEVVSEAKATTDDAPQVAFTRNADFLIVAQGDTADDSLAIYRRSGVNFNTTSDEISSTFTFNSSISSRFMAVSR